MCSLSSSSEDDEALLEDNGRPICSLGTRVVTVYDDENEIDDNVCIKDESDIIEFEFDLNYNESEIVKGEPEHILSGTDPTIIVESDVEKKNVFENVTELAHNEMKVGKSEREFECDLLYNEREVSQEIGSSQQEFNIISKHTVGDCEFVEKDFTENDLNDPDSNKREVIEHKSKPPENDKILFVSSDVDMESAIEEIMICPVTDTESIKKAEVKVEVEEEEEEENKEDITINILVPVCIASLAIAIPVAIYLVRRQ